MSFTWKLLFSFMLLLYGWSPLHGQSRLDTLIIEGIAVQQPLEEILHQLSDQYRLRIYYPPGVLPGAPLEAEIGSMPLPQFLDRLLAPTPLSYLLYRDQAVVIGDRRVLQNDADATYFQALEQALAPSPESDTPEQQVIVIGDLQRMAADGKATVEGRVLDEETEEPIIGATLYVEESELGTTTDAEGTFSVTLPTGDHRFRIQYVGYGEKLVDITLYSDGSLTIYLPKESIALQEVIVEARAPDANVSGVLSGVTRLDIQSVRELPAFLGEVDILKGLLLQPGVSTIGEGAAGFNVRGGTVDQNLIMQDESFLFNSAHALGFFSTFNSDLIGSVELYKGIIPAQYGGRLASVLDVEMRNGNFEKFQMRGGIGPLTARVSAEGPVIKDRSAFIAGVRGAFSDWVLKRVPVEEVRQSAASFYDANLRYTHRINDIHTLSLAGYTAFDRFRYANEFGFSYKTNSAQAFLRSVFSSRLFSRLSLSYSLYDSEETDLTGGDASRLTTRIEYVKAKEQLTWEPADDLKFDGGISSIYYKVNPGQIFPTTPESSVETRSMEEERGLESALFANAEWSPEPALSFSAGLRLVWYQYLGPKTVFSYAPGGPPLESTITDTVRYGSSVIADYTSLEPRLSARYRFGPATSVKAGYSRTAQFINQITDAGSPTPTSIWQLSTSTIEPQRSHNFSAGFFQNFNNNQWETSAEVYYRYIDELFDYRDFAELTVNDHLETELLPGIGRAYGLELSLRRKSGRINGWISYTFSRSQLQIEGINRGDWYPAIYDKPHSLSVVTNLQLNKRNRISINFNYSTGRPITAPIGRYRLDNRLEVPLYSQRNQLRIPDYHRLDIAYTFGKGFNKTKRFKTSWTISIYNVYGRRNAYSVYFTQKPFNKPEANRLSILGGIFPSLTVNFELL